MAVLTLYNPYTEQAMKSLLDHPPHALLLYGDEGAGKFHLAKHIASEAIGHTGAGASSANTHTIQPENQSISIDQVRRIKELVKLKVPGNQQIRRIIIIQDAHMMREEAQNALLKTLEEPPADTMLILTALSKASLADTVTSRLTSIPVRPVTLQAAREAFVDVSDQEITRSYHLSGGNIGLFTALISGVDHPLLAHMDTAKKILSSSIYMRLCMIDSLKNDSLEVGRILYCMKRILDFMLRQEISEKNVQRLKQVVSAESDLYRNIQPRLILTDLFLNV